MNDLVIFAKLRGTSRPNAVKNALEVVGLAYKDKKLFSKYSLGMKQRLGIANAIMHDPELLILDVKWSTVLIVYRVHSVQKESEKRTAYTKGTKKCV